MQLIVNTIVSKGGFRAVSYCEFPGGALERLGVVSHHGATDFLFVRHRQMREAALEFYTGLKPDDRRIGLLPLPDVRSLTAIQGCPEFRDQLIAASLKLEKVPARRRATLPLIR